MATELSVISTPKPSNALAMTNAVFVSPSQSKITTPVPPNSHAYVKLGKMVYVAREHKDVEANQVALNAKQRDCCKVSLHEAMVVEPWCPPTGPSRDLFSISFLITTLRPQKYKLVEAEVVEYLKKNFVGHAMTSKQVFIADFRGIAIGLTVMSCSVPSEEKDGGPTKYSSVGLLASSTDVSIDADPDNKKLTFEKSASSKRSPLFRPDWKFADMGIGGLDAEFSAIFRRSFASRLFPPEIIAQLGIKHVKGMLLFGPPGTGKTLIARQIGKMLSGKKPRVVNGPEILDSYVGNSEKNIRELFEEAEADYAANGESAELHIIIFDEIDAICKQRGTTRGTGVGDTVVNQMLSKIDGVDSPNNILVIGMTNRKDMIDSALLRPGRLEVHVEIGLPDEGGRQQILGIHTRKMREGNYLDPDVDLLKLAQDTKNFSGAEIEGLVKNATSYALYGTIDVTKQDSLSQDVKVDAGGITVTMADFEASLAEMQPAFGVSEDDLKKLIRAGIIPWGEPLTHIVNTCDTLRKQTADSASTPLMTILLEGRKGTGKTAIAAKLGIDSEFPFVKLISPDNFVNKSEVQKCDFIHRTFEDAYKSPMSLIVLDNLERLLEYVPIGQRFSNTVLQTLLVLLGRAPTNEHCKLLVVATTSCPGVLDSMQLRQQFNVVLEVPQLVTDGEVTKVLEAVGLGSSVASGFTVADIASVCALPISIKPLLMVTEMARQGGAVTPERFQKCIQDCGLDR